MRFPPKLRCGDLVRVIAPARSRAFLSTYDHRKIIEDRFREMGLWLSYGEHVDVLDEFDSSPVAARTADLHAAFADPDVAAILTVIGGYNSNELLPHLDWDLIAKNPKIFCGYSDITALQNAILARTGLVTKRWFVAALFDSAPVELRPAGVWTDDAWFADQDNRRPLAGEGWWPIRPGTASGRIVGGNLDTLNLLQGTPFMPRLEGSLLLVEDDEESSPVDFARDLTSLLQLPDASGVRGLVIGRFQQASNMTRRLLERIVHDQPVLAGRPVLANVEFGHTTPMCTFPIGGTATVSVGAALSLTITER